MRSVQACHPAADAAGQEAGAGAEPGPPPEPLLLAPPQPATAVIRAATASTAAHRLTGCPSERVVRLLYPRAMGDNYTPWAARRAPPGVRRQTNHGGTAGEIGTKPRFSGRGSDGRGRIRRGLLTQP